MNDDAETQAPAAPAPAKRSRRRRCDNCGARLRGRFCIRCGQRDRDYDLVECENCGAEKQGHYCAVCGQNDRNYRRNIFPVVGEVMAETFETDSRLVRTLAVLFTRPGFLSLEFSRNRRARYLSPFRLYLFTSILFFFVLSFTIDLPEGPGPRPGALQRGEGAAPVAVEGAEERPWLRIGVGDDEPEDRDDDFDEAPAGDAPSPGDVAETTEALVEEAVAAVVAEVEEGAGAVPRPGGGPRPLTAREREALERLSPMLDRERRRKLSEILRRSALGELVVEAVANLAPGAAQNQPEVPRYVVGQLIDVMHRPWDALRTWIENLPVAMFCLLPVFALMLKLFYIGSRRYYSEHLVFAMQNHTVAFIAFTVTQLLPEESAAEEVITQLLMLGLAVYYFVAMRRFYGGGFFATAVKFLLLLQLYGLLLLAAMAGAAIAALLLF